MKLKINLILFLLVSSVYSVSIFAQSIVTSVTVPSDDTYISSEDLDFTVNWDENVTVVTTGGIPSIPITIGIVTVQANYVSGSGTSALLFRYTVSPGDEDTDGIAVGASISLNSGTIKNAATNDAALALNSVGSTTAVLVDAIVPTIASVSVPSNDTYVFGEDLDFTVNWDENVTVITTGGIPSIPVTLETGTVQAVYQSGSGTSALLFRYTVSLGDEDADGIAVGASISLNSGTIKDAASNNATTTLNSVGSTTAVLVDAIVPTIASVSVPSNDTYVSGEDLDFTVNWDENVTVITTGGIPSIPVTLETGTVQAVYQSGSGTSALLFRYTVSLGDEDADGIAVGASISLNSGTIKDAASNNATTTLNSVGSTTAVLVDAIVPTIASVSVPSNDTYVAGEDLDFTVNWDENVTVITTGGIPSIPVTLETGTVQAVYQSGSGTSALLFRYTVSPGDEDTDGIAVGGSISLNSGTIKDAASNNATTTLNSVGSTTAVLVDAIVPTITSVSVPSNDTYVSGEDLDFTVNWDENVTVVTTGGIPSIPVTLETGTVQAVYQSGSGTSALLFRYTVSLGDEDTDGIAVGASILLNSGTIKNAATNDAALALNSVGSTAAVLVDAIVPTITSVSVPSNDTYVSGEDLDFTVNWDENVTVVTTGGIPSIPVTLETGTVQANYVSGSGTSALLFRYTVSPGDEDADGIAVGASISLNSGTIKDAATNDAALALNSLGSTTAVLVDAIVPMITSVSVPSNDTYVSGEDLDFTVNWDENVTVVTTGGIPSIPVTLETGTVQANYVSGSGTSALLFRYTVSPGDEDTDGIAVGASISLNSGTIKDAASNNATTTLNSVGSTTAVLVDAIVPTITSVSVPSNDTYVAGEDLDFTVNWSESVNVVTTGGIPSIPVTLETGTVQAVYQSGSGTSALLFRYTVSTGDEDTDGIAVGASISLNSGTIKDAASNNATTTLNSVGSTIAVLVDAIVPTIISVSVPSNDTYVAGEDLDFTVNWSESVNVVTTGGIPSIPVTLETGTVQANYVSGSGTSALLFKYTVISGDEDTDGIAVDASILLNSGTIKDAASNNATTILNSVGSTIAVLVDAIVPTVSTTAVPANGKYEVTDKLEFTLNWNENVTVSGSPFIPLTLDTPGAVQADYVSGSGTTALLFRYTVVVGDEDASGIAVTETINLDGGTIRDAALNDATLTFSAGNTSAIKVDAKKPAILSVDVPADGYYNDADNLDLVVNFDKVVDVTNFPFIPITLNTGGVVNAAYTIGTGTSAITFRYPVVLGNLDLDGIEVGASIDLNGGAIKDGKNEAILLLSGVGVTTGVLVDAVDPTLSPVSISSNNSNSIFAKVGDEITLSFTSSESLSTTPVVSIGAGSASVTGGPIAWTATYPMTLGDSDGPVPFSIDFVDDAGNTGTQVTAITTGSNVTFDKTQPTVVLSSSDVNAKVKDADNVTITANFTELNGIDEGTPPVISIGGLVTNVAMARTNNLEWTYSWDVPPGNDGFVTASILATDAVGNTNAIANGVTSYEIDNTPPTAAISYSPAAGPYKSGTSLIITATFNEEMLDSPIPQISLSGVSNLTATNMTKTSETVYTYTYIVPALVNGTQTVSLVTGTDLAGNVISVVPTSGSTFVIDNTAPTLNSVSIASNNSHPDFVGVNGLVTLTIIGSENLVLTSGDVKIDGNNATLSGSGASWTASYTMQSGDTPGELSIEIDNYEDNAGNPGVLVDATTDGSKVNFDENPPGLLVTPNIVSDNTNSNFAKPGDLVTLKFTAAEAIENLILTIGTKPVTAVNQGGNAWEAEFTASTSTPPDTIAYTIQFSDFAGNVTGPLDRTSGDNTFVVFDGTAPNPPSQPDLADDNGLKNTDNITSVTSPRFAVSADPYETVLFYSNEVVGPIPGTVTEIIAGLYLISPSITLVDGNHIITATATDGAGNISTISPSLTITIDGVDPDQPDQPDMSAASDKGTFDNDDITNILRPTFAGKSEGNARVYIYDDAAKIDSTDADIFGIWNYTMANDLTEGDHAISVEAKDLAGNLSIRSIGLDININSAAPAVPSKPDLDASSDTGADSDDFTKVETPIFNGTAVAGTVVKLYRGLTTPIGTVMADGLGAWSITSSSLPLGLHSITATATDLAGNTSAHSLALLLTIDNSIPNKPATPVLDASSDNGKFNNDRITSITTPKITGTAEPDTYVKIYTNNVRGDSVVAGVDSSYEYNFAALTSGTYSIHVVATDRAGNSSVSSDVLVFTIDANSPDVTSIHLASNNSRPELAKIGDIVSLTFTSNEEIQTPVVDIEGIGLTATGGPTFWTATHTLTGTENEASLSFSIQYRDIAGNAGGTKNGTTDLSEVVFDKTAPSISPIHIASDHSNSNMARVGSEVNISFTSNDSIEGISVKINNKAALVSSDGVNQWKATSYMSSSDPIGTVVFEIDYKDLAGNPGSQKTATTDLSAVSFDKTSPGFNSVMIASNNLNDAFATTGDLITLAFETSEAVETPSVLINNIAPTISGGPINWIASRTAVTGETEGIIPFTIEINDLAGNSAPTKFATTNSSTVTFDESAPGITSVTVPSGVFKVGDLINVLIKSDGTTYEGTTVQVNGKTQSLINNQNNNYSISYLVNEGDNDLLSSGSLPVNIVLQDSVGLSSSITSATTTGSISIDAHTPQISTFASSAEDPGNLIIGDSIVFTLTPLTAEMNLLVEPTTYNGALLNWNTVDGSEYKASYIVQEGDPEHSTPLQASQVVLSDVAGNASSLSYSGIAKHIYATYPSIQISGTATKCDYGQTVPISFNFSGTKPFSLTYNNGTEDVGPIMDINAMFYRIDEEKGTFTLVNLTDSTGNFITTSPELAAITVNPRPVFTTEFTKSPYNIESGTDKLAQYVVYEDTISLDYSTGSFTAQYGISYENGEYVFKPADVNPLLRDKFMDIVYTYTLPTTGCSNSYTSQVWVSSTPISIVGLKEIYCEGAIADTIFGSLPKDHSGVYELFTLEGDTVKYGWSLLDSTFLELRPEEFDAGDYLMKYTAWKDGVETDFVDWKNFSVEAIRTGMIIDNLELKYCLDENADEIRVGIDFEPGVDDDIDFEPLPGDIGTFSGSSDVFTITPGLHTAKFKLADAEADSSYSLTYIYESAAGCKADPITHTIKINPLPVLSFTMKSNYDKFGDVDSLIGIHPIGDFSFSGDGIVNGEVFNPGIANSSTGVFTDENENIVKLSGTDSLNGCYNSFEATTHVYQSIETIGGVNSEGDGGAGLYCYDESIILELECESNHDDAITGIFRSLKLDTIAKDVKTAAYPFKDVGEGEDSIFFEYYIDETKYTVAKFIEIDGFGYADISVPDNDYDFCNSEGKISFGGEQKFFDGRKYNEGLENETFGFTGPGVDISEATGRFEIATGEFAPGDYTLVYDVETKLGGCVDHVVKTVNIFPEPVTDFEWNKNCPLIDTEIEFSSTTTIEGDNIEAYKWEFAGTKLADTTNSSPIYSFASDDFKTITLTAISSNRCAVEKSKVIQIGNFAKANFTWDNDCNTGEVVSLESTSEGGDVTKADYKWYFDQVHDNADTLRYSSTTFNGVGEYNVKLVYTSENECTDSILKTITVQPYIKIVDEEGMTYIQGFESENYLENWQASSLWEDSTTRWDLGSPDGDIIIGAKSGENAWFTKITDKNNKENSQVVSPCFDLSGLEKPMIKMNIWSSSEASRDGAILQYSLDYGNKWYNLGEEDNEGVKDGLNWFDTDFIQSQPGGQYVGWNYPPMIDWTSARHNLDSLKDKAVVRFRVAYAADGGGLTKVDGFAFDDVWIGERQQNVLAEYFTNSERTDNPDGDSLMAAYEMERGLDVIPIHYHTANPQGDEFYNYYKEGPSSRVFYYGVSKIPAVIANGSILAQPTATSLITFENSIDLETLNDPEISFDLEVDKRNANVSITANSNLSGKNLVLYTAIVKDTVVVEKDTAYNVLRKFLPDPGGTSLDTDNFNAGQVIDETIRLDIGSSPEYIGSRLVVFVQNSETKQVYQAVSAGLREIVLSIRPGKISNEVDVYPNPAIEYLFVDSKYKIQNLVILDLSGRIIEQIKPEQSRISISLDGYKDGIYFIRGETEQGEFVKKFIKQK